ncbi:MAG: PQQ-binding-like beta-propeller repeat protein [Bacteroidales bacterium]|nr:PQQ-binding-like beta-propeller repeat protein [Bacteroidales bacterium]
MRHIRRLLESCLALGGCLVVAGFLGWWPAFGQNLIKQAPIAPKPADDSSDQEMNDGFESLALPKDRDSSQRYQAVLDYLAREKNIPWDIVCGTAQQLLDSGSDSFYEIEEPSEAGQTRKRYVSIKDQTNRLIGAFPAEGRQFYQLTFGPPADAALKAAIKAGYDPGMLAAVSQRYFHTDAGGQAALLIATLNLHKGNYVEAAYGFARLLARPGSEDLLTPLTLFKAAVAFKRAPEGVSPRLLGQVWERLERQFPRDGLLLGGKTYSLEELRQERDFPVEMLFGRVGDQYVTTRYGNAAHTGVGEGGTPFLSPSFVSRVLQLSDDTAPQDGRDWIKEAISKAISFLNQTKSKGQVALPGFFPVTAPNLILYRTYDGVYARVTKNGFVSRGRTLNAGDLFWMTPTKGGLYSLITNSSGAVKNEVEQWWRPFWEQRTPTLVFENAQVGSLSHDGKLVYFIDDVAVPPPAQLFNPQFGGFPNPAGMAPGTTGLRGMTEYSRLVAVDMMTGKLVWSLGGLATTKMTEEEERKSTNTAELTDNAIFLGPPVPINGKLYVLYERDSYLRLACIDPHKLVGGQVENSKRADKYPELIWTQNLGRPNTPLHQDSLRRIQPVYLTYADGVLVCPTNCGAVIAVDINARSLLWARGYGTADPQPKPINGRIRRVPVNPQQTLPQDRWRASAPIIADGKVIVTAYDSDQIQCLDLRTGNILWADAREKDDLMVGGVVSGTVVVVGKNTARGYALNGNGKPIWKQLKIGTPAGHGVATKDGLYYIPMLGDPDRPDSTQPQVWAIDAASGQVRSKTAFREKTIDYVDRYEPKDSRIVLGNLVFHEGQLFSQSATRISAFPLIELKKREMDRLLAQNPNDPKGLTFRGELLLDDGKLQAAVADFKAAEKHNPPEEIRRTIREKLYQAYTELLRNNFDAAEGILNEYQALCEIPIDTENELKRQELLDEQIRRKGLYLSLVARGREKQGRLVEAFDHYRAFASLGDNSQLFSIFDEPNGMTRPDVWARGRIDAMIRNAKDPATRKPLEDRVTSDWEAVRGANDLKRLREFVQVFGPYFPSGREAQLLLAEKLLLTNNDDDMRDAQIQLMQLWATAEDDQTIARAIEALARVMTRRGMLEDAVGLYAQLGTRYAEVVVRDGKTGAELYGELITDKRLLPYLEPARGSTFSSYNVEFQLGNTGRPFQQQTFTVRPDGDLLPFFARYRLTMEMNPNGGTEPWVLRVTDHVTGEDRCKFPGLSMILGRNGFNQGPPSYRVAQASGHLLLMNIGQFAYCFDLAEKRELWRYNLFGNNFQDPNQQPQVQPPQPGEDPNELVVSYPDGWTLRLGRSAVIQPNYVCLVTRDGLVALDPYTKELLWQRTNVSTKAQVFGDARHLFLIETSAAGTTAKVLRAVDGSIVENVPDFAAMYASSARVGVWGRHILLSEGGDEKPRVLRLYDPLTGQDAWSKQYPPQAVIITTDDRDWTGSLAPDGSFEVLHVNTGKLIFQGQIDAANLAEHTCNSEGKFDITEPYLLMDAERVYLFLNRKLDRNRRNLQGNGFSMVKSHPVNGAAYGFDRTTGKRLWFYDGPFENQLLILERFDELPVLIAAAPGVDEEDHVMKYNVIVLDKRGRLDKRQGFPQNGAFVSMYADPKTRAIELWRYDLRLRIEPKDSASSR